jgi:hypothetical protein
MAAACSSCITFTQATTGKWLIGARRRCCRAGRSQATERDDSWASSGDDSWPVVVARHRGHRGGPWAGVQRWWWLWWRRRRRRLLPSVLRRPIQDCQWEGERRRDGMRGWRFGAMGWFKHSIPTGLSVTKAANILEMLRGNEVRCGN